ncbi:hypothetical protein FRC02_007603 [Tulasnella sp. 418]|nr:hypothetical protein FRC02_007603 [Tulasnella sp. 418]
MCYQAQNDNPRIFNVSEGYHKSISHKKEYEGESTKTLAVEALGLAMISHGSDFDPEAAYGQCLGKLGRAHCRIAQLQEDFAQTFYDTWLGSIALVRDTMREYNAQRKKLESRRLTFDAARTKLEKAKKEKDRKDAEEEFKLAKSRYEEASEEVQRRMYDIQDNEIQQLRDLTDFLDLELSFVTQYYDTLLEIRNDWVDESAIQRVDFERPKGALHTFVERTNSGEKYESNSDFAEKEKEKGKEKKQKSWMASAVPGNLLGKAGSIRTKSRSKSFTNLDEVVDPPPKSDISTLPSRNTRKLLGEDDDEANDIISRTPNSQSRARSRANSTKSASGLSVTPATPPRPPSRANTGGSLNKRWFRALYDYDAAAPDELSFQMNDEILGIEEVVEGWWKGECGGDVGLFPVNYTVEEVKNTRPVPPPRHRPASNSVSSLSKSRLAPPHHHLHGSSSDEGEERSLTGNKLDGSKYNSNGSLSRTARKNSKAKPPLAQQVHSHDFDEHDEPFGDHYAQSPADDPNQESWKGSNHSHSIGRSRSPSPVFDDSMAPLQNAKNDIQVAANSGVFRKAPPPPPPIRRVPSSKEQGFAPPPPPPVPSQSGAASNAPPRPALRSKSFSTSNGTLAANFEASGGTSTRSSSRAAVKSPFDGNASDRDKAEHSVAVHCSQCDCDDFKQNPFKPKGNCSSCFHFHT